MTTKLQHPLDKFVSIVVNELRSSDKWMADGTDLYHCDSDWAIKICQVWRQADREPSSDIRLLLNDCEITITKNHKAFIWEYAIIIMDDYNRYNHECRLDEEGRKIQAWMDEKGLA